MASLEGRRVAVLTLSETLARGEGHDGSGDVIVEMIAAQGAAIAARDILPDDRAAISERLRAYADEHRIDLVLTAGGSGVAPTDVTPEATLDVIDRLVP